MNLKGRGNIVLREDWWPDMREFPGLNSEREPEHPEEIITRHAVRMGHAEKVPLVEGCLDWWIN